MKSKTTQKVELAAKIGNGKTVQELERIRAKYHGKLLPQAMVNESEAEEAPLHAHFEWDDKLAANMHRCEQARNIVRSVTIVSRDKSEEQPLRYYVSVSQQGLDGRGANYVPVNVAMSSPNMREEVLRDAITELVHFQRKYNHLKELAGVMTAIKKVVRR